MRTKPPCWDDELDRDCPRRYLTGAERGLLEALWR